MSTARITIAIPALRKRLLESHMPAKRSPQKSTRTGKDAAYHDLFTSLQRFERLYQFRDPNNACLFDLRVNECYALELIALHGPISVANLADKLGIHKSNASRMARTLETKGHIEQDLDTDDARLVLWRASKKGAKLYNNVESYLTERYQARLASSSASDLKAFVRVLTALTDDAEERMSESNL